MDKRLAPYVPYSEIKNMKSCRAILTLLLNSPFSLLILRDFFTSSVYREFVVNFGKEMHEIPR